MKKKLLTGWTWTRIFFLVVGILVLGQGIDAAQWPGVALGVYISAMGIFGWRCASGGCHNSTCSTKYDRDQEI